MTTKKSHKETVLSRSSTKRRRVALGSAAGTAVEYYDFTVYGLLSIPLANHFFKTGNPTAALLSTFAIFAVAFLLRPVGGILFGHLGDKYGRKQVLTATILLMTGSTFVIGILPTYSSVGLIAPLLLLAARVLQGLSAGGEASGAGTFIAESVPNNRRAFYVSGVSAGAFFGALVAAATIVGLRTWLPDGILDDWGWRIPFLLSLPIGLIGFWIRQRLEESPEFLELRTDGTVRKAPIAEAVTKHPRAILIAVGLALFPMAGYYAIYIYMPTYLTAVAKFDPLVGFWSSTITLLIACAVTPLFAAISDRVGRKPVFITASIVACAALIPAFSLMNTGSVPLAITAQIMVALPHAAAQAVLLATLTEQFPAAIRYSAVSLGYNIASVLAGGTAPYIATWLVDRTGDDISPAWFVITTALLTLTAAITLRETAGKKHYLPDLVPK